jgi:outer membrane protein assembly factor BamB
LSSMSVKTLVGGDLFEFGDSDGVGDDVRLQHPLGLAYHEGSVFIADTYNHKIKLLDLSTNSVKTFVDGKTLYEPGGISYARGKFYVADTNNHAVKVIDKKSRTVTTLIINGLKPPSTQVSSDEMDTDSESIKLDTRKVSPDQRIELIFNLKLPPGYHLNIYAPNQYSLDIESGSESISVEGRKGKFTTLPVKIPFRTGQRGRFSLSVNLRVYYCREDNTGTCHMKALRWQVPLEIGSAEVSDRIVIDQTIEL